MALEANFGVDSYHLNVGSGDCAIHLKIRRPDTANQKPTCLAAVLIDGGNSFDHAQVTDLIKRTIKELEENYAFPDYQGKSNLKLRFDAIVATHWHEDHVDGIIQLVREDLAKPPNRQRASFMKYTATTNDPETVMYFPYWTKPRPQGIGTMGANTYSFAMKQNSQNTGYLNFNSSLDPKATPVWKKNICRVDHESSNVLGVNFFNNKRIVSGAKITTADQLLSNNPPEEGHPAMYCIAHNGGGYGTTVTLRVIPFPETEDRNEVENRTSITAIIMWKSNAQSKGRISHYTAGDLPELNGEDRIVEWLKDYTIVSMKASHHGAAQSFPPKIVEYWKPRNIVISCGKAKSTEQFPKLYCHPRWELILWLELALRATSNKRTKVLCTCYPYYFTKTESTGRYEDATFGLEPLQSTEPHYQEYRALLQKLNNDLVQLELPPTDIPADFEEYKKKYPTASDRDKKRWVVEKTIAAWNKLCKLKDSAQAFFGGHSSTLDTMTKDTNVQYVMVRSRSDESKDGVAVHKFFGKPWTKEPEDPKPAKSKPAGATAAASKPSSAATGISNAGTALPGPSRRKRGNRTQNIVKSARQPTSSIDRAAIIALAVPAVRSAFADPDQRFFIYASDVSPSDENYHIVTDERHKAFIENIHRQVIVLEAIMPAEAVGTVKLDDSDEMYAWLQDSLGATISAHGQDPDVNHFSLEMAVIGQNLIFDTATTPLQFKFDGIGTPVDTWGLPSGYNVMVFGLQSGLSEVTISDLFDQVLEMDMPILMQVLATLTLEIVPVNQGIADTLYQRNAIWFIPEDDYTTVMRLQLRVPAVADLSKVLASFLGGEGAFSVTAAYLMGKKTMKWSLEQDGLFVRTESEAAFMGTARINGKMSVDFSFSFAENGEWEAAVAWNEEGPGFDDILVWLASLVNVSLDFNTWIPESVRGAAPRFRRVAVSGTPENTIAGFRVDFECQLRFGGEDNEITLVLLSYSWPSNILSGSLWQRPPESDFPNVLHPNFESVSYSPIPAISNITDRLSLSKLFPDTVISDIPEQVFPYVDFASLEISPTGIAFSGGLVWEAGQNPSAVPMVDLATVALDASYDWTQKTIELSLGVSVELPLRQSNQDLGYSRAILNGAVQYADQTWTFHAGAYGLNIGALYEFFDSDSRDGVMDMLEVMEIEELSVDGTYSKGKLTNLGITGIVVLGGLQADLQYRYDLSGWSFEIGLGEREASATIGDIVGSIVGPSFVLPVCVSGIKVSKTPESKIFSISVNKINDPTWGTFVMFKGNFQVAGLGFTFAQMRKSGSTQFTKRVIKVAVSELPTASVPLVGDMTQPFDELAFLWVDDASPAAGLTRAEVLLLNKYLFPEEPGIRFKDPKPVGPQDTDVVSRAGLHFLVTLYIRGESKVILDHRFGSTKTTDPKQLTLAAVMDDATRNPSTSTTQGDGEVTTAPIGKTFGPLTLSNIGLQYKNDTLYIILDASFQLGPLMLALIGFGIGVGFDGEFTLQNIPSSLSVTLQGLGVGFDKPPIGMNGLFLYTQTAEFELYSGAMTVSFRPYSFMAAGFYGKANVTMLANSQYTTVFIYTRLAGPLVQLGYVEISGICGGFGYNNTIRQPSIQEVVEFPFIGGNTVSSPLEALVELTTPGGWVTPRHDTFWLAAGLDVKALRLVSIDAVIVVEFNPYVKLGIYAVCRGSLPPNSTRQKSFLFIEFGILASIDFEAGIFKVEGQISPNSFILSSSCHLQGGFAFFYWFNGSEYDGDWVFSVGGYHPAYTPLDHYPRPPRLGISWTIGGGISVQGLSYFAITPKCCMAGGQLQVALSLGPLSAWLNAATNFLINYNPFYFTADVSVSVGVAFTLDLWIVTIRIKAEIKASLRLSGPPFQGLVHVDFWVFGFYIHFGAVADQPKIATLEGFWELLLQQGLPEKRRTTFAMKRRLQGVTRGSQGKVREDTRQDHVLAIESGLVPSSDNTDDNSLWVVRAGILVFMVQSRFAVQAATCTPSDGNTAQGPNTSFYAKPMQLTTPVVSTMHVTITKREALFAEEIDKWRIEPTLMSVPVAIWGKYSRATDPQVSGNNIDALLNAKDATVQLMMGVSISAPLPTLSLDKIPKFNLVHAMSQDVYPTGMNPPFPPAPAEQKPQWVPAPATSDQYDAVQTQWRNPKEGTDAGRVVFALWAEAFVWAQKDTVGMTGALPVKAVEKLGQIYMAPPLLSSG